MSGLGQDARRSALVAVGAMAAAFLLVLLLPAHLFLSSPETDLVGGYAAAHQFTAQTLASGRVPLWNPFVYGGEPFLGNFESAVLYPPNLLFLVLPLERALNFILLLHLVILGWGMERWARQRGLSPWAAALAGFVLPLSGPVFPHLYAGHFAHLCTMAWAPWLFLGLEIWIKEARRGGLFLAAAAICLQILAGHIQYFFYTAVAAGIYALVVSLVEPTARRRALPAVAGCYLAAIALGAAQLLPGLAATSDGIRQQNLDRAFAAMFSFPPENFLTLLAPGFFGSLGAPIYWGRCYLWEMSLFFGAVGPALVAIALVVAGGHRRGAAADFIVAVLLMILALGAHTFLFDPLYQYAPAFGHFRGWAKFSFPAMLFLVQLAARGADLLLRGAKIPRSIGWITLGLGVVAALAALVLLAEPENISAALRFIGATHESYLPAAAFTDTGLTLSAGSHAGLSLGLAALVLVVAAGALLFLPQLPVLRGALPVLLAAEMIGFAAGQVAVSHFSDAMPSALHDFVAAHPGDYRVLDFVQPNNGIFLGAGDLSGNNPSVLKRYAEFISFTQGADPDHASQYLPFRGIVPLYAMLRFRYAFVPIRGGGVRVVNSSTPPMPRLALISDEKVLAGRDDIFAAMRDAAFDPAKTVLLETEPDPRPQPGAVGTVRLVSERAGELVIEADTDRPTLLLVTDLYARDWRAEALPGSSQTSYRILPADYVLRAVPLQEGHHRLRMVYAPPSFPIGLGISAVSWVFWIGLVAWDWRRPGRPEKKRETGIDSRSASRNPGNK